MSWTSVLPKWSIQQERDTYFSAALQLGCWNGLVLRKAISRVRSMVRSPTVSQKRKQSSARRSTGNSAGATGRGRLEAPER